MTAGNPPEDEADGQCCKCWEKGSKNSANEATWREAWRLVIIELLSQAAEIGRQGQPGHG